MRIKQLLVWWFAVVSIRMREHGMSRIEFDLRTPSLNLSLEQPRLKQQQQKPHPQLSENG